MRAHFLEFLMERHYSIKHGRCRVASSVSCRGKALLWMTDGYLWPALLTDTPRATLGTHPDVDAHQRANQQTTHQRNQHHNR